MNRNARIFCFLVFTLAALVGCSSEPSAKDSKKAANSAGQNPGQGPSSGGNGRRATDAALNAGGPSVYLWEGTRRYRLFLRTPVDIVHGSEYVAEGVNAQKAIDEIGDPDQGKNGYPLASSCEHVVRLAWGALSFDLIDAQTSLLRATVKRHPQGLYSWLRGYGPLQPRRAAPVPRNRRKRPRSRIRTSPKSPLQRINNAPF